MITAFEKGQQIDLSGMPPPPPGFSVERPQLTTSLVKQPNKQEDSKQRADATQVEEEPENPEGEPSQKMVIK